MKLNPFIFMIFLIILPSLFGSRFLIPLANSQSNDHLPILLIHGFHSGPEVWNDWLKKLHDDGFIAEAAYFPTDDHCGSTQSHAQQLSAIIQAFKNKTHSNKINIVTHSKGGLDARMYLAHDKLDDVKKLIMIGTPNHGTPMANWSKNVPSMMAPMFGEFLCAPAVDDLIPGSNATQSQPHNGTMYYTIAGNWTPSNDPINFFSLNDPNCKQGAWLPVERWGSMFIKGADDGMVPLSSAAPKEFKNIGVTNDCHTNLIGTAEYDMVKNTLLSK